MHIKNVKMITERMKNRIYNFQISRGSKKKKESTINPLENRTYYPAPKKRNLKSKESRKHKSKQKKECTYTSNHEKKDKD